MNTYCHYHCSACHAHFASLNAFDSHRQGSFQDDRHCVDPDEVAGLGNELGTCRIGPNAKGPASDILIYFDIAQRENARKAFSEHLATPQTPSEVTG